MKNSKVICIVANSCQMVFTRRQILTELLAIGNKVVVLAPLDPYLKTFKDLKGLTFFHLKHLQPGRMNPGRDFLFYRELKRHFERHSPSLIFTFTVKPNIYGAYAASRLGIRCIPTVTGLGYSYLAGGLKKEFVFFLYKRAFRRIHSVFFLNSADQALFESRGIVSHDQCQIVPGAGVNLSFFSPQKKSSSVFRFLFVGRLLGHKGLREYVEAAEILISQGVEVEVDVVGPLDAYNPSVIEAEEVAQWITKGLVNYYGEAQDVRPFYQECDILVMPSYREGISTVILEALAMERPVIAADVPGCRDVVNSACGWLVPPKNSVDLARQMRACTELKAEVLNEMGKRGRSRVEQLFSKEKARASYIAAAQFAEEVYLMA